MDSLEMEKYCRCILTQDMQFVKPVNLKKVILCYKMIIFLII